MTSMFAPKRSVARLPRKRSDTPGTSRALFWLTLVIVLILLGLNIAESRAQSWQQEPRVYFNPEFRLSV